MTSPPVFVVPFEPELLGELSGQSLVVRTTSTDDIPATGKVAAQLQCKLEAVILETDLLITSLPFEDSWKAVPLLVYSPELGRVSRLLQHIPVIRGMSLRFMLPTEGEANYSSLRVLSSLGIPSGFQLRGDTADWERLLDLATYYYFNFMGHAPIAPLDVFGDQYVTGEGAPFGSAFLEDSSITYLHVNREGQVALSSGDLEKGDLLYPTLEALKDEWAEGVREWSTDRWSRLFMSPGPCPACPALKLCRRRVASDDGTVPEGCSGFFTELMGMIEDYQALKRGRTG